ncbi:MAG: hypothetical protein JWM47_2161 [Acidimicrobiales bacterium]|nr:hypothetical protein [Acidimicrobiales bacterium]
MAKELNLDPELRRTIERGRAQAEADGEILTGPSGMPPNNLSPEARAIVKDWVASGDYDRVVAEITANDPDLATQ